MPWHWDIQLARANCPVTGISWFEARAYARWLNAQMRGVLNDACLDKYQVMLPIEPQWEWAARASGRRSAHESNDSRPICAKRYRVVRHCWKRQ